MTGLVSEQFHQVHKAPFAMRRSELDQLFEMRNPFLRG